MPMQTADPCPEPRAFGPRPSRRGAAVAALLAAGFAAPEAWAQTAEPLPTPSAEEGALDAGDLAEREREAADETPTAFPRFVWGLAAEVETDDTVSASDPAAELVNTAPTIEGALGFELQPGLGVYSTLVMEQVEDPDGDSFFEDVGLYAEEIYLGVALGQVDLAAGKYDPPFGFGWDVAPGIYGVDFAEDYQLTERLGASASTQIPGLDGSPTFTASLFWADTTFLSESLFTNRGELKRSDGGASNSDTPSFALYADGELLDGLTYGGGVRWQAKGDGDAGDETGLVGGLIYGFDPGLGEAELMGEVAWFDNFDAGPDDALYTTLGAAWSLDQWTVSGVWGLRDTQHATTDNLLTASVEYAFTDNVALAAGYRYGDEDGETSHTIGLLLVVELGGDYAFGR